MNDRPVRSLDPFEWVQLPVLAPGGTSGGVGRRTGCECARRIGRERSPTHAITRRRRGEPLLDARRSPLQPCRGAKSLPAGSVSGQTRSGVMRLLATPLCRVQRLGFQSGDWPGVRNRREDPSAVMIQTPRRPAEPVADELSTIGRRPRHAGGLTADAHLTETRAVLLDGEVPDAPSRRRRPTEQQAATAGRQVQGAFRLAGGEVSRVRPVPLGPTENRSWMLRSSVEASNTIRCPSGDHTGLLTYV
jgi:hypothetical protein